MRLIIIGAPGSAPLVPRSQLTAPPRPTTTITINQSTRIQFLHHRTSTLLHPIQWHPAALIYTHKHIHLPFPHAHSHRHTSTHLHTRSLDAPLPPVHLHPPVQTHAHMHARTRSLPFLLSKTLYSSFSFRFFFFFLPSRFPFFFFLSAPRMQAHFLPRHFSDSVGFPVSQLQ